MSASEGFLLFLRLAHAFAAATWFGGGVYYLVAVRPALRDSTQPPREFVAAAQSLYGEWARTMTIVMIVTGVIMTVDRLSSAGGGLLYAVALAVKIVAALAAFWLAGFRLGRRSRQGRSARRSRPEWILGCGALALGIGVALASIYGQGLV